MKSLFLILFTAASLSAAETPKRGGTLRLAFGCRTLDPAQIFLNHEATLARMIFNNLLDIDDSGNVVPDLAESLPEISADGLTYTFRLRQGVRFSSGREFVADDVVFTFERFFDPKTASPWASYFKGIAGGSAFQMAREQETAATSRPADGETRWIDPKQVTGLRALDSHTIEVRLERPDLMFLQILTGPMAAIIPRREFEQKVGKFGQHPVGTGPFALTQWVNGVRMHLERNPSHFRPDHSYFDGVDVILTPMDSTLQAMMFERGELDLVTEIADPDFRRFKRDPQLSRSLMTARGAQGIYVALNCELPPFTNRLVRVALNHAVDRQSLVRTLLNRGMPSRGVLPMSLKSFNPVLPEYRYDPGKARALLAEAGFPDGFETTLLYPREGNAWTKAALVLEQQLRAVGVRLNLKEASYGAVMELSQRRRTTPMTLFDMAATVNDPKDLLDLLLNGDNITEEACQNAAFYANEQVQQLFRAATIERDSATRIRLYQDIEERVVRDAPWIFLCHLNAELLCQPWVNGFKPRGFWPPARLENCWLDR